MQTVPTPTFAATGIHLEPDRVTVVALERFAVVQFSMDRRQFPQPS